MEGATFCSSCGAQIGNNATSGQTPAGGAGGGTPVGNYAQPGQPGYYAQTPGNQPNMNQSYYQPQQPGGYGVRPAAPYPGASSGIGIFKVVSFVLPLFLLIMLFFGWFTSADYGYGFQISFSIPQLLFSLGDLFRVAGIGSGLLGGEYGSAIDMGMLIYAIIVIVLSVLIVIAIIAFLAYIVKAAQVKQFHTRKLSTVLVCIDLAFILSVITMIVINALSGGTAMGLSIGAYITGALSILGTFIVPSQLRNELAQNKQPIMR
jgi:hypothetical protein